MFVTVALRYVQESLRVIFTKIHTDYYRGLSRVFSELNLWDIDAALNPVQHKLINNVYILLTHLIPRSSYDRKQATKTTKRLQEVAAYTSCAAYEVDR